MYQMSKHLTDYKNNCERIKLVCKNLAFSCFIKLSNLKFSQIYNII